ncbi:MAG: hypothetical protein MJ124_09610 [Lachnospiraceae bacterium]|nr:hypothetical protein [Lachnospiraceae bacterium]
MKKWNNAEFVTVEIAETAYGKNLNAREANAGKHKNNGAGGDLNTPPVDLNTPPVDPTLPEGDKNPDYTTANLSGGEQ